MSLVWNEDDEIGIKVLQQMSEIGTSFIVPKDSGDAEFYVAFKVEDYWKANRFLMDLMCGDKTHITGIKATSVGFNKDSTKIYEAQKYIQRAMEILNEV